MFAHVLSRPCIFLTIILMLPAISSHAVHFTLSHLYTAAKAANEGGDNGFMNKYLLSDSGSDNKVESTVNSDDAPSSIMTRTSSIDIACPIAPPVFFVWVGSVPRLKHKQNMFEWYYSGHPVILWYHPEGLSELDKRKVRLIERVYSDPRTSQNRILVLNLKDAGLDTLNPGGMSITEMIGVLTRGAKFNPKLYAMASNLARLALLVKGQKAIMAAVRTRNNNTYWDSDRITAPVFNHTGVIYLDTDIYYTKAGELNLPHPSQSYGIHIFKDHDGVLRMNNDILYAQMPHQPFFEDLLREVIGKFEDAIARGVYNEYLDADPPHFNGAHFVRKHLSADLRDEPAIHLDNEPQQTEGNWHPKGSKYTNELPSSSSP